LARKYKFRKKNFKKSVCFISLNHDFFQPCAFVSMIIALIVS